MQLSSHQIMGVYDDYSNEDVSPSGERTNSVGTPGEVLTRVELDLAYFSEKVLNLEILLMQVANRANDCDAPTMENEDIPAESVTKAFESIMLSGILNSEINELDNCMTSLQIEIELAHKKLPQSNHFNESSTETEEKLLDAEESLEQLQNLVADIKMQSEKFERTSAFGSIADEEIKICNLSSMSDKWKLQTMEQQRHVLQMLEKSLARELDLEKKLSESKYNEEVLKMKLHYAEREAYRGEEYVEMTLKRIFEAENAAELLLGIAKELMAKLQTVQFNLKGSIHRECVMKSKLQESMMKLSSEVSALEKLRASVAKSDSFLILQENSDKDNTQEIDDRCLILSSDVLSLREKVTTLEEQLRESEFQLPLAKVSVEASQEQQNLLYCELKTIIAGLKENVLERENRAESAEAKCTLLMRTNVELNEELDFLRKNGTDKAIFLAKKLKESDTQFEHAKASVSAIEEHQNLLYSALSDMENLIEDLKGKVSKAERRAESAESKCTLLTDTNFELNEELDFLRGKLDCLDTSLRQVDDANIATAKDICLRIKIITELVMKLSLERERLLLQTSTLAKRNKILSEKCLRTKDNDPSTMNHHETNTGNLINILQSSEETETKLSAKGFQVGKSAAAVSASERILSAEHGSLAALSKLQKVRSTKVTPINSKCIIMAFVAAMVSVAAVYLFHR